MQLQLNITSDSPAELATLLAALAPHFAGNSTPVEAVLLRDQSVASESTAKRTRAPKAPVAADPVAAYNAMAAAAGAPAVETPKADVYAEAAAAILAKQADAATAEERQIGKVAELGMGFEQPKEKPKALDRQGKTLFIIEKIKALTLPKARVAFQIPDNAPAFSMWAEEEIERVYALAVAA